MNPLTSRRLLIIGAGPKAAAIAARCDALRSVGYETPEIFVIEKHEEGANWRGDAGYTDGSRLLCTPAERDVGFPYDDNDRDVSEHLLAKFSWHAFQIKEAREYARWVDRGSPNPTHAELANYCRWVLRQSSAKVIHGLCTRASVRAGLWRVNWEYGSKSGQVDGSGLVVTGPGPSESVLSPTDMHDSRVFDGFNVWDSFDEIGRFAKKSKEPIGVIGSGGTAAAIVGALLEKFHEQFPISVFSRKGTLYTRGDNYFERQFFSNPQEWTEWGIETRRDFISRVDRGVISNQLLSILSQARNVFHFRLAVKRLAERASQAKSGRTSESCLFVVGERKVCNRKTMTDETQEDQFPVSCVIDASSQFPRYCDK